jgi:hypothetical protein
MAIVRERCRSCGLEIDVTVGQAVHDRELVWHKGYSCPLCGSRTEEDGRGPAPDDLRCAVLHQEGRWALELTVAGTRATIALKLLRQALNLSLGEIGESRKRLPGVVVTGTRAEMDRLLAILSAEGLQASVAKLPAAVASSTRKP